MRVNRQHIGLGPMGTAVFYAAHNMGGETFEKLFDGDVALIERSIHTVGCGQFCDLAIDTISDPADTIRYMPTTWPFGATKESRDARSKLDSLSDQEFCSFRDLSAYYNATGRELIRYTEDRADGSRFIEAEVDNIVCDTRYGTFTSFDSRKQMIIQSNELVLATGGA